jgi:hypothetical protein
MLGLDETVCFQFPPLREDVRGRIPRFKARRAELSLVP